jgi:hypothetical protein
MTKVDRIARLSEKLTKSRFASETDHVLSVVRGIEPVRHGLNVEVERAENKRAPNGSSYHVRIKASTDTIARDRGIIPMSAWSNGGLRNFAENPVILAFHDHKQPIGRSVHTELADKGMLQYWEFHGETDVSRTMQKLYEKGFMRAASVGFLVHEFTFVDELSDSDLEKLVEKYGAAAVRDIYWIAEKAELLETSAVPVPSDPTALTFDFARSSAEAVGIDISSLRALTIIPGVTMTEAEKAEKERKDAEEKTRADAAQAASKEVADLRKIVEDGFKAINEAIVGLRGLVEKPKETSSSAESERKDEKKESASMSC